jgi:membrane protein required for colicin V production
MSQLPVNVLDLAIVLIMLLSAILASVRGFTREILAIGSWVVAGFAAYTLHPLVLPYLVPHITKPELALAASIAAVFFSTLVLVSLLTVKISDLILDSSIGALDRTLGFIFGAARGFLIAVIAFMFFDYLVGENRQPEMLKDARFRPALKQSGDALFAYLPSDPAFLGALRKENMDEAAPAGSPKPGGAAVEPGKDATTKPDTTKPGETPKASGAAAQPPIKKTDQQTMKNLID